MFKCKFKNAGREAAVSGHSIDWRAHSMYSSLMKQEGTSYRSKALISPKSLKAFAGVRGRVRRAVAALPESVSYEDAVKQIQRFQQAQRTS
jgi:hypothetical protein